MELKNGVMERTLDWKPGDLSSSPINLLCDSGWPLVSHVHNGRVVLDASFRTQTVMAAQKYAM